MVKHKQFFHEIDHAYRCIRSLKCTDGLILKTKYHVYNAMLLWRELKIPVTLSAHIISDFKTTHSSKFKLLFMIL